jgi:hypothetical protein
MNLDTLRADAANIMNGLNECWSPEEAITPTADVMVRIHPGINRDVAIVAAEQARWAGWP